jgi:hypothetical protein
MSVRSKWIGLTAVLILSNSGYVSPVIVRSLCGSFFMSARGFVVLFILRSSFAPVGCSSKTHVILDAELC